MPLLRIVILGGTGFRPAAGAAHGDACGVRNHHCRAFPTGCHSAGRPAARHGPCRAAVGGPFQGQDYRVARACMAAGMHYIDLADGRAFVAGIDVLNAAARAAGVAVVSGASSVPALSSAAVDHLARGLRAVRSIDIGISPGNRTERGLSTVRAILGYCGQPLGTGGQHGVGWSGTWCHRYAAPVGKRLLSPCDVPDLDLLSGRYAGAPSVRFGAGLELRLMHRGKRDGLGGAARLGARLVLACGMVERGGRSAARLRH